jgi:hypothetical protein
LDRLHIRVHLWWVSRWIRQLLVVTGTRCPAVELQATTEPHCSRGAQPGGVYAYVVHHEPTPGGPGSGLRPGRKCFLCQPPPWFYRPQALPMPAIRIGLYIIDSASAFLVSLPFLLRRYLTCWATWRSVSSLRFALHRGFLLIGKDGSRRDSYGADGSRSSGKGADGYFFLVRLRDRRIELPGTSTGLKIRTSMLSGQ